jgi:hypothetical protein
VFAGLPALVLGLGAAVFFSRPPALILSDAGFDVLYGAGRTLARQAGLSARLFRQVKRVTIAENANPEAVAFAVEEKAKRPWAVFGHARYSQGLEQYARQHPEVRVAIAREEPPPPAGTVLGEPSGGGPLPEGPQADIVYHDVPLNSRRAGRYAALLAGEDPGVVLVFQDSRNFPVDREAFLAGLREERENLNPVYLDAAGDYPAWDLVRCVVLGGPAKAYLERKDAIPALFFSWMDPALSSSNVKIVGDDSLWALARGVFAPSGGEDGGPETVPADFIVLENRIRDPGLRRELKKAPGRGALRALRGFWSHLL